MRRSMALERRTPWQILRAIEPSEAERRVREPQGRFVRLRRQPLCCEVEFSPCGQQAPRVRLSREREAFS